MIRHLPAERFMPTITFIEPDGTRREVAAATGESLMLAAIAAGVAGIDALCGGACLCATCQVHVAAPFRVRVGAPESMERDLLSVAEGGDVDDSTRLSCQIPVTETLDGLIVRVAARQG